MPVEGRAGEEDMTEKMIHKAFTVRTGGDEGLAPARRGGRAMGSGLVLCLLLMTVPALLLASCTMIRPTARVVSKPSDIKKLPGKRPWLYLQFTTYKKFEKMVELSTPGGGIAYMTLGKPLQASYKRGLGAFFSVHTSSSKGHDQYAEIDMDEIQFLSFAQKLGKDEDGTKRARLDVRMVHSVKIYRTGEDGILLDHMPVDISVTAEIHYTNANDFATKAGPVVAELFRKLEHEVLNYLVEHDTGDKYIYVL